MAKLRSCTLNPNHKYEYCPSCGNGKADETWRYTFCSENCRDIFTVASRFGHGHITAEEAKELMSALDTSEKENYPEGVQENIAEIMGEVKEEAAVEEETATVKGKWGKKTEE